MKQETGPIAENINAIRTHLGLTESQFGKLAGFSQTTVSSWERGDSRPRIDSADRIVAGCKELGLDIGRDAVMSPDRGFAKVVHRSGTQREEFSFPVYGNVTADKPLKKQKPLEFFDPSDAIARRYPYGFFIRLDGEEMNRVYPRGSLVLIDPECAAADPVEGMVYFARVGRQRCVLRRLHIEDEALVLTADSTEPFDDIVVRKNPGGRRVFEIIGRAVYHCSMPS